MRLNQFLAKHTVLSRRSADEAITDGRVIVNGNEASILGWKPYRVDITKYIQDGRNSVEVEVVNSLQNLLGPHHYLPMEGLVTPGSFYCKEDVKFDKSGFSGEAVIRVYKGE